MDEQLFTLELESLADATKLQALISLESGKVIYLPTETFTLKSILEKEFLSPSILDAKHKNISFDYLRQNLSGFSPKTNTQGLEQFMQGYAQFAKGLIITLFPSYEPHLKWGRTSYRPAEIQGRALSKRKDDRRLHIDSFSSSPVNGQRILRVFTNINPEGKPRIWNLGEDFKTVAQKFAPHLSSYNKLAAKFLHLIRATKTLRSSYDHYQLQLHDKMKLSDNYQQSVSKREINFAAASSWIVFSDQVSHAALGGQFLLEQTFYLPVTAMLQPELSPLHYWQNEKRVLSC